MNHKHKIIEVTQNRGKRLMKEMKRREMVENIKTIVWGIVGSAVLLTLLLLVMAIT